MNDDLLSSSMLLIPIFIISVTLVSHVSATAIAHRSIYQLLKRQSTFDPNEIPAVCTDRCAGLVSTVNACATSTNPACGCTFKDEENDVDCLNCILYSSGVTPAVGTIQSIQTILDEYVEACNLAGTLLPATTLSGAVSGITSTFAGKSFTSVDPPTLTSATGEGSIPTRTSDAATNQETVTTEPTGTKSASGIGGLSGISGNKNSGSQTRRMETAGAAVAVAAVLVVFF